jgi:hypothetical protein
MDTYDTSAHACAVCGKAASTFCADCGDNTGLYFTLTYYCDEACQIADWQSHERPCQAIQAQIKLFRAGHFLQECFLATRAEAFDPSIMGYDRDRDGTIHIFDRPENKIRSLLLTLSKDVEMKDAVLSLGAGCDVFSGLMFEFGKRVSESKCPPPGCDADGSRTR